MNLKDLQKQIPYSWRVQSFSKFKAEATCVAYIDARDVMNLLDEIVKPENWQSDFKVINNNLYAGIGIRIVEDAGIWEWVWKWDCGTESAMEKEKGESSDAFKRAAVKWGVGRFLYDLDMKRVPASEKKDQSNYPYCVDEKGNKIWDLTKYINDGQASSTKEPPKQELPKAVPPKVTKAATVGNRELTEEEISPLFKKAKDVLGTYDKDVHVEKILKVVGVTSWRALKSGDLPKVKELLEKYEKEKVV